MKNIHVTKIRQASLWLAQKTEAEKNKFLEILSKTLEKNKRVILLANKKDVYNVKKNKGESAFIQRLIFDAHGLKSLQDKLTSIQKLSSGIERTFEKRKLTNG